MNSDSVEVPANSNIHYRHCEMLFRLANNLQNIAKALDDFCVAITNCRRTYNIF